MSRRNNFAHRCRRCRMHASLCVCVLIPDPKIDVRTRLALFIHRAEDRKATNTGRLATECLANSEVFVRGHAAQPSLPFVRDEATMPVFLYPDPSATPLAELRARDARPIVLIVPDGNWRQASKVRNRVAGLQDVPFASLPADAPSTYRLRTEPNEGGLATMEAIARALGILEGAHVRAALEKVFQAMVERTLWARGAIDTFEVAAGIPEGALRHDPRSGVASARATLR